jgi:hypothetical protein
MVLIVRDTDNGRQIILNRSSPNYDHLIANMAWDAETNSGATDQTRPTADVSIQPAPAGNRTWVVRQEG